MHVKTMEGLAGASKNHSLLKVPIRVFKEARRKGDTGTMERAMEYASDFAGKAREYQAEAEEGMKEDAREAEERKKLELEKVLEGRKEEREKAEERIKGNGISKGDILEVSDEGKILSEQQQSENAADTSQGASGTVPEPLVYDQAGEAKTIKPSKTELSIII